MLADFFRNETDIYLTLVTYPHHVNLLIMQNRVTGHVKPPRCERHLAAGLQVRTYSYSTLSRIAIATTLNFTLLEYQKDVIFVKKQIVRGLKDLNLKFKRGSYCINCHK